MIDEGYIKFQSAWERSEPIAVPELESLMEWRRPLYAAGLVGHLDDEDVGYGNISARCRDATGFVISGTQTGHLADPGPEHYSLVTGYDFDTNVVQCRGAAQASSESLTHAAIYELDPSIRAVVHVHSEALWQALKGELPTTADDIAYGTPDMAREFQRLFRETAFSTEGVAVMGGHENGLVSMGGSVKEACDRILALRP